MPRRDPPDRPPRRPRARRSALPEVTTAIRVVTLLILVLALLAFMLDVPARAPSYALGSDWVLRTERAVAVLLAALVVGLVIVRGLIQGRLPSEVSQQGLRWEEAVGRVEAGVAEASLATKESVEEIQRTLDAQAQIIEGLVRRQAELERRLPAGSGLPSSP